MEQHETFISAPFGNWVKPIGCIPVTGTYTLNPRGNRLWRIAKTLRYSWKLNGWVNALGLPNPGFKVGLRQHKEGEVFSIAEVLKGDFKKMDNEIPDDFDLELNLSCPSIAGQRLPWDNIERFLYGNRKWCIAKISPLTTPEELEFLIDKIGFSQIHACNTLPIPKLGRGLSGASLVPYVNEIISVIEESWPEVTIVAGGGIKNWQDMYRYLSKGADHVSLGTVCFNPLALRKILKKGKDDEK